MARHALSLIAAQPDRGLDAGLVEEIQDRFPELAAADWLSPGVACELAVDLGETAPSVLADCVRAVTGDRPIDVNVIPLDVRRKRLLVADMDSTIIAQECIDELADAVGLRAEVAGITERAMRGEIAFEPALRERVALLRGLPLARLEEVAATRISLNPGAQRLIATLRTGGARAVLVSGGFTLFTERVATLAGFDAHRANRLEVEDGRLTGRVVEPILGPDAKRSALIDIAVAMGIGLAETLAVGDGANDLGMIRTAGLGVAFRAKPVVAEAAAANLAHADLTGLLYLQGYRLSEIVAPE